MTPADGLAFFTSAMSRIGPGWASAAKKSRTGGASASRRSQLGLGRPLAARGDFAALGGDDFVEHGVAIAPF